MMVELTYQMVLGTVQTLSLVVGIIYYLSILRNQQKNKMIDMVFQRMHTRSSDYFKDSLDINSSMFDWDTVEEFNRKFNWRTTPEIIAQRKAIEDRFTAWGMLLRQGLTDIDFVAKVFPPPFVITWWERSEPIYLEERRVTNCPGLYEDLEFLYTALKKRFPEVRSNPIYDIDNNEIGD